MSVNDIIGKGKDFEPPFSLDSNTPLGTWLIDNNGKCVAMFPQNAEKIAYQLCNSLNHEHNNHHRMCLRDKSKVCDLCHDCDIDVLNPGDKFS